MIREILENLFRERKQDHTTSYMEKGIDLFKQLLLLTNDIPYIPESFIPFDQLRFKPVNVEERMGFIAARPHLFHSYRQLSELMVEQEKLYTKKLIKKSSR
ncbi:hypothetical protein HPT25_24770 [Bacillus sp. BRMEA1]|nr:hypothetical protein [Neobacillus endophyticus]